ncbi:MAG: hypothetical protein SF028_00695 [Candidatus Sumerlaeia bacterium]|nr:hypothetical protein [Candidatus Sumerlaeia bacterium]
MTAASDPSGAAKTSRAHALIAWILFTAAILSVALVPIRADNDCWWHVKTGQFLWQAGELPKHDVFNYLAEGYEWHNHEWLAQLWFHAMFAAGDDGFQGGWRSLVFGIGLHLWAAYAILLLLAKRITGNWWLALLITLLAIGVGRRTFYPRPPVISYVILAGLVALFTAYSEGWITRRRWLLALLPLTSLWTNLHGAWFAGLIVMGAYGLQGFFAHFQERAPNPFERSPAILPPAQWIALGAAIALSTFANPYGRRLWELPVRVLSDQALVRSIGELQSPDFFFVKHFEAAFLATLLLALFVPRFRPRIGELAVYLFFFHQAIQHVRHLTLFGIVMVPLVARLSAHALEVSRAALADRFGAAGPRALALALPAVAIATMAVLLKNPVEGQSYPERNAQFLFGPDPASRDLSKGIGYVREAFPAAACDFIELARLEGNMFNRNHYAGYLIWRFSPETHRVFADSRFDIFGGDFLSTEIAIEGAQEFDPTEVRESGRLPDTPLWQRLLDQYDVQWMLIRGEMPLASAMGADPDRTWTRVAHWPEPGRGHLRSGWQVWIRDTAPNAGQIARARSTAAGLGVAP